MNHGKGFKKLGKKAAHRKAILNNLLTSLIKSERLVTTKTKAKEVQRIAEKALNRAKNIPYEEYKENFEKRKTLREEMKKKHQNGEKIQLTEDEQKLIDNAGTVLHNYNVLSRRIKEKEALVKLVQEIAPRLKERNGGFTRVLHLGKRRGDASEMVVLELVDKEN